MQKSFWVLPHSSIQVLLQNGADVEKKTKARYTPLILAAARGALEISKILLMNQVVTDETFLNLDTNVNENIFNFAEGAT